MPMNFDLEYLAGKCLYVRRKVLEMSIRANSGHISTAYSQCEMLVALYYGGILKVDPANPKWPARDRFILSKGQGGLGLYPILADMGFFPTQELDDYLMKPGKLLGVHSEDNIPGIEVLTGSLGHGLPLASGIAWALREQGNPAMTVVLTGDGELCEGSNWEALLTIYQQDLGHLIVIVDHNGGATIGHLEKLKPEPNDGPRLEPLDAKFKAFGFEVVRVNGHDLPVLMTLLPKYINRDRPLYHWPLAIISDTVKGKGIKAMEDGSYFPTHYSVPRGESLRAALRDLGVDETEFKNVAGEHVGY